MLKRIIKKIILREKYNSETYVSYLKKKGVKIGKGTYFFTPSNTFIDTNNPFLIKIGNYCKITSGVRILTHDYSYSVLRRVYHDFPQKAGVIEIGDNVFIGVNSIILLGSKIGDNCIIGAGSVVSGTIPSNQVWGGNPARYICTLDEYHNKCVKRFEENAKTYITHFKEHYKRLPKKEELRFFNTLFSQENEAELYEKLPFNGDDKTEVLEDILHMKKKYKDYDDFINNIM